MNTEPNLTQPVARYLVPLRKGVDLNRHLASQGAELFANVLRHLRGPAHWVRSIVSEQMNPAEDLSNAQAESETAEREEAERKLAEAKHKLEAAKLKREAAERTLAAAMSKRETAERETAERATAERETA